jgi:hypothetical protein
MRKEKVYHVSVGRPRDDQVATHAHTKVWMDACVNAAATTTNVSQASSTKLNF